MDLIEAAPFVDHMGQLILTGAEADGRYAADDGRDGVGAEIPEIVFLGRAAVCQLIGPVAGKGKGMAAVDPPGLVLGVIGQPFSGPADPVEDADLPVGRFSGHEGVELEAVQAMLAYISREYAGEVRLCDVARAASFSLGECCRMFRRVTGRTLSAYIREYRVTRAAMLLRGGDIPVSLVAERTGFRTASYLISCFRAVMGVTPLQYRRRAL